MSAASFSFDDERLLRDRAKRLLLEQQTLSWRAGMTMANPA